jgi:CRP/FNR family transcriptional regulator, cyclic AMP receptor protein
VTDTKTSTSKKPKLSRGIGVRPGEGSMAVWISVLFGVTQASHGLGMNTADTLFFLRFGVDRLPLMILISGVVVMGAITVHIVGLGVTGPRRWLWIVTTASALLLVSERLVVAADWPPIYPVIWIANQAIMMVTLTVMWNAAEQSCDTRQAKRLFPLFATAGVIGGVAGNAATGPLAAALGTANLLLVQAGLLTASTAISFGTRRFFRLEEEQAPASLWSTLIATPKRALSTRLGRLAAMAVLLVSTLFFLIVFPFNEMVAANFSSEVEVAGFLGAFSSVATAATFVFSLLATRWLFGRLGVVLTLLVVPIVYAAGLGLWLVDFGLVSAALVRGVQWVAVNAIWGTAFPALFNVVPGRLRSRTLGFMIAIPAQIGTVIAGGLLLMGEAIPQATGFGIGLVLALAASWIVYSMRPAYLESVVAAVRYGLAGVFTLQQRDIADPTDRDATRILTEYLHDERPQARAFAAASLARLGETTAAPQVKGLLDDPSPTVRSAALDSMCIIAPEDLVDHVAAAVADDLGAVRLQAVRYLVEKSGPAAKALLESRLEDPDERVRAAAAVALDNEDGARVEGEMLASGAPRAITAVLQETTRAGRSLRTAHPDDFLAHPDSRVRMAAVVAGAGLRDPQVLAQRLEDRSPGVRRAAARVLASVPEGHRLLVETLQTGSVNATDAALDALVPLDEFEPRLANWAETEARRAALLAGYGHALAATSDRSPTLSFLISVLSSRSDRLIGWVIAAMTTRQTEQVMAIVERGVRSRDAETRAQATEALETIGARSVLKVLIPLLETPDEPEATDRRDVLRALSEDFDPWIRALALRTLADEVREDLRSLQQAGVDDESDVVRAAVAGLSPMAETVETLDPMDRALALHVVPMFAALDPEDLELIAATMAEVRYEPDERIYTDGEAGDEMLVIVGGSAVVSKERDGLRHIVSGYGPGYIVGELAVLVGGRRVADVDAGETGLHGLALTGSDLLSILEERPTVGMGMLGTLATRLAEQT